MRQSIGIRPVGIRSVGVRSVGVRSVGVGLVALIGAVLAGCASPAYQFVSSSDRDVVIRLPRDWNPVDTNAVLKAAGVDPTTRTNWLVFYDGSSRPSVQHVRANSSPTPVLIAQSFPITAEQRAALNDDQLRNALLPVTADARAAAALSGGTAGTAFKLLRDETVSTKAEHGVHVVFSYRFGGTDEFFDQVTVTNPKRTRGQMLVVHCSRACYETRTGEIASVVSSLTLKTP